MDRNMQIMTCVNACRGLYRIALNADGVSELINPTLDRDREQQLYRTSSAHRRARLMILN
jgi:hypothetical protein